jgi:GNAT superfamily N-acetyltransferase
MNDFSLRCFIPDDDFPALLALVQTVEAADAAGADVSETNLRRRLTLPGFDPLTDQILAQNLAGETVGQTSIWLPPESDTAFIGLSVHPQIRRRGLGSQLLESALRRARMLGAKRAALNVWQPGAAGHLFLRQHGLRLAGHFTRFSAPLPLQAPLRGFPAEFTIRTFAQVAELEPLARAFEQCYAGLWGHHSIVTLAELQEWLPQMDPEGILLVCDENERVVGMCRVEINAELSTERGIKTGSMDAPGWVPAQRSAAHTTALLFLAADWLSGRGAKQAVLESWGDPPETLLLFQRAGFQLERQISEYVIELDGTI